jgi:hypothetical protein
MIGKPWQARVCARQLVNQATANLQSADAAAAAAINAKESQ